MIDDVKELKKDRDWWFNVAVERGTTLIGLITMVEMNISDMPLETQHKLTNYIEIIKKDERLKLWKTT